MTAIVYRQDLEEQACEMVAALGPADLSTGELAALVAVLGPAHARFIDRPILRLVPFRASTNVTD